MYQWNGRVRFSETGEDKRLTLNGILNYFQDCTTFQSEDLGNGMEILERLKRVWVLSAWQIVVNEYPEIGEKIVTGTWPYEFNRFMGKRNFIMYGEDGRVLAYANSVWTYLNTENGRPARIDGEILELYTLEQKYDMAYAERKIALPDNMQREESFRVELSHLDSNHHVNNGRYVMMAAAYLPEDFKPAQMRAEYKKQAFLGDVICPRICREGARVTVSLEDETGSTYAAIEFLKQI